MAKKQESEHDKWVKQIYHEYLEKKGTGGGFPTEYKNDLQQAGLVRLEEAFQGGIGLDSKFVRWYLEMLGLAADAVWHKDPSPPQRDLFSVAGVEIEITYTFPDPAVPGGFRRVQGRWATPRHAQMDADVARFKANEAALAAREKADCAAKIMLAAGGNPDMLLWTLRDGGWPDGQGEVAAPLN